VARRKCCTASRVCDDWRVATHRASGVASRTDRTRRSNACATASAQVLVERATGIEPA
jgi:hypothetical protein